MRNAALARKRADRALAPDRAAPQPGSRRFAQAAGVALVILAAAWAAPGTLRPTNAAEPPKTLDFDRPAAQVPDGETAPAALATTDHPAQTRTTLPAAPPPSDGPGQHTAATGPALDKFLDRLMIAESGGSLTAKNPRSSALGPYQFIDTTFLAVVRRHFATETAALSPAQILALRTDRAFSRRAAAAFTQDNADQLAGLGLEASYAHLRLAHLLGAGGAARILRAPTKSQVALWLGPGVITANPFMAGMRVEDLVARCEREISTGGTLAARPDGTGKAAPANKPSVAVRCDLGLASCRRWLALAERRTTRVAGRNARTQR